MTSATPKERKMKDSVEVRVFQTSVAILSIRTPIPAHKIQPEHQLKRLLAFWRP